METKLSIGDFVEATIQQDSMMERFIFEANTILEVGKRELAKLVGGLGSNYIDRVWVKVDGNLYPSTLTSDLRTRENNTLILSPPPFTITGTYTAVLTGCEALGYAQAYNSIPINLTLSSGQEVTFIIKWIFTGLGQDGNLICASRLGNIADAYNYPISSIELYNLTGSTLWLHSTSNSFSNNTLDCDSTPISVNNTFNQAAFVISNTGKKFELFGPFTITTDLSKTLNIVGRFIFG